MGAASIAKRLDEIAAQHGSKRRDGGVAGDRTQEMTRQVLTTAFNVLHDKGYRIHEPENLGDRHLKVLVRTWYETPTAPVTMRNYLSCMKRVYDRMGKRGLIRNLEYYLPDVHPAQLKRKTIARKSKSWTEAGIDVLAKIAQADALDERFGMMLRAMLAFGLRRKEVLKCKPWKAAEDNDRVWRIYPGEAKGGRPRIIVIETPAQKEILNFLRSKLKKGETICWSVTPRGERATAKWALNRYNDLMKLIGITMDQEGATGHGLRAQYAENAALIAGLIPPTLSGDGKEFGKDEIDRKRAMVSENLGHSRIGVTGTYYGSFSKLEKIDQEAIRESIKGLLADIEAKGRLEPLCDELKDDCKTVMGAFSEYDIPVSLSQIQTIWRMYSQRHGVEWVKPTDEGEIERGLYVVATMQHRKSKNAGGDQPTV